MQHHTLVAGVDEVGRGPLAGPVVAAAVILHPRRPVVGCADSKTLSARRRAQLFEVIQNESLAWAIGMASVHEINTRNILQASLCAMQRALYALPVAPELVLVDGVHKPRYPVPQITVVRGDAQLPAIAAASIMAKVVRDNLMQRWDSIYPGYGFAQHKGYGTKMHRTALRALGATPLHRPLFLRSILGTKT